MSSIPLRPVSKPAPAALADVRKSTKLADVCYDIRGPVLERAKQMEEEGHRILKLNIGNPAPFGFDAPDEVRRAQGLEARRAPVLDDPLGQHDHARPDAPAVDRDVVVAVGREQVQIARAGEMQLHVVTSLGA